MVKSAIALIVVFCSAANGQTPNQRVTVNATVHEVMYLAHQLDKTKVIKKLESVKFRWNTRHWAADTIVDTFVKSAERFFATPRPPLRMTLSELSGPASPIDSLILSEINDQGGKSRSVVPVGRFSTLRTLDQTKTYTLTPPLSGYDCSLTDLRFADGEWRLFEVGRNRRVDAIECKAKNPTEWIVKVEVTSNRAAEANQELARAVERAIDRLGSQRQPRMRSYTGKERDLVAEMAATPQDQRNLAVKATFVLRVTW